MTNNDQSADYLQRAAAARAQAASASNFMAMDELLDIAAAWRALAVEADKLKVRAQPSEKPLTILARPPLSVSRILGRPGPAPYLVARHGATIMDSLRTFPVNRRTRDAG